MKFITLIIFAVAMSGCGHYETQEEYEARRKAEWKAEGYPDYEGLSAGAQTM